MRARTRDVVMDRVAGALRVSRQRAQRDPPVQRQAPGIRWAVAVPA
jgi:hypothetical protein